jgi:signal transduction histidine kinase
MRRLLPDSLAAWALLIVIGGLAVVQISTFTAVIHSRAVEGRMLGFFHLASRVSSITHALADRDRDRRSVLAEALSDATMTVTTGSRPLTTGTIAADDELAELEDILESRMADLGISDVHVERRPAPKLDPGATTPAADGEAGRIERVFSEIEQRYAENEAYLASIELNDGSWLNFVIARAPTSVTWSPWVAVVFVAMIVLVLAGSIWALRHLTMPYTRLAAAAERFGQDINAPPLPVEGPREVRAAARAFNAMQERLRRVIGDRDQLAAAISHDLRTPVTRLRLRAEFMESDEQRRRMLADLDDIEVMTQSVLTFSREAAQPEPREVIDLVSLLESLCDDMPSATLVTEGLPSRLAYRAEPVALKRAVANLIDNAVRYGGSARVSLWSDATAVRIAVEDDGPGIPESEMEAVFRPFRRLETSRNRETGGTGLGLTIARTVARAHGGDIVLSRAPSGGLHAEIVLPLAGTTAKTAAAS